MPRFRIFAICLTIGLLCAPAATDARSLYFGISANSRNRGAIAQDRAAETGVNRLREDLEWWRVQPSKGEWTWTATDAMYRSAAERGLSILPIPNAAPCWATPAGLTESECKEVFPVSTEDYAAFVGKAAARYGPGGDFWNLNPDLDADLASRYFEIWNEPYWGTGPEPVNPSRYAALYKAAVISGRTANPATRYLIESTVGGEGGVKWAAALKAAQPTIGSYIDGLAVHPYPGSHDITYQPKSVTDEAFVNVRKDYESWIEQGIKKPVWITEVGYSSCSDVEHCVPGSTQAARETKKAEWLSQLLDEVAKDQYGYVHALYLYNLEQWSPPTAPNKTKSAWYGLLYGTTGEHLPAWTAFASAVSKYNGSPTPSASVTSRTIAGSSASFSLGASDPTASFECQLDSGAWSACASPKTYSGVGLGTHTFRVRAINAEATSLPASYTWSNIYLRPNADERVEGWSLVGATSAWDALNDSVTETQTPSATDYITHVGGFAIFGCLVELEDPNLSEAQPISATARFYTPDSSSIKMAVRSLLPSGWTEVLATVSSSQPGWKSVSFPLTISGGQAVNLSSLTLHFLKNGSESGSRRVYATFVQLAVEP